MASHTETERLDWVIGHSPEFEVGYLRLWLGSSASPSGCSGYHIAHGDTTRECIDKALDGHLVLVE